MADARDYSRLDLPDHPDLGGRPLGGSSAMTEDFRIRTPMGRVRGLGSARSGTKHFWQERLTSVAGIPLTIAFFVIVANVLGRNHAAVVQILGSPLVAILLLLFIFNSIYHMWLG